MQQTACSAGLTLTLALEIFRDGGIPAPQAVQAHLSNVLSGDHQARFVVGKEKVSGKICVPRVVDPCSSMSPLQSAGCPASGSKSKVPERETASVFPLKGLSPFPHDGSDEPSLLRTPG